MLTPRARPRSTFDSCNQRCLCGFVPFQEATIDRFEWGGDDDPPQLKLDDFRRTEVHSKMIGTIWYACCCLGAFVYLGGSKTLASLSFGVRPGSLYTL